MTLPPIADPRPHALTTHNHTRIDPYHWLRDKHDPAVLAYLEAENAYTAAQTADTTALQERLFQEMKGRIQETDQTAPVRRGDFLYYSRTVAGLQYAIHCRCPVDDPAAEQVLVDLNAKAEGQPYMSMGIFAPSPDNRVLAYALDNTGAETFTVHFLDMRTGVHLPDQLTGAGYTAEWANDNRTLLYTTENEAKRSYRCWSHRLGDPQSADRLLHQEDDALFNLYLDKTKDNAYLVLLVYGIETHEVRVLRADEPEGALRVVHPREPGLRYTLEHRAGLFYLVTNADGATNSKIVTASADAPERANWQDWLPHDPAVQIQGIDLFADHLVVVQRADGLPQLRVCDLRDRSQHLIAMPEAVYDVSLGPNVTFETTLVRYVYTSLTTPSSTFDYDMATRTAVLVKQQPVLGGYDPADYTTARIWATAEDGARVPISLVHRRDLDRSRPQPLLLFGYGAYGYSYSVSFDFKRLSLLERGFIIAIAHIRGGQELGRAWYDQGKFLHKKNSFTDFIACARQLIADGYTTADRLAASGRSAGGLLMGAVANLAPELFHVIYAGVPFVDVVTSMLDESIPLTVGEFDEWGNPKDPVYYAYMLSYSPYDNVAAQAYPHLLVTAGLNDPRVQYWEPAKWVAKLRTLKTDDNRLLLKMHMGAGHFSSSGRYDYLRDYAFEYAFILDCFGLAGTGRETETETETE